MAWDHFRSVAQQKVYTVFTYESRALLHHLDSIGGSGAFDLIHVDSLDLARYLPYLKGVPIVLGHHNVESALLARRASVETSRLLRLYLRHQSRLMAREEARWAPKVNLNLVCSKEDAQSLRGIPGKARVAVMPNGVDTTYLRPLTTEGSGILFLGAYDWFPNRDGMSFFLRQILPEIRSQVPDSTVTWVGRVPDGVRKDLGERFRLKFTGHVPDFRPWVKAAACMIVPLRVGGGTRLKIIEGWSMGQAMVSTTLGCEGLRARDGENLLIRDEPKAFAEAVIQLLSEPGLRKHLGENGRVTAVEQYDWGALAGPMLRQYQRVLASDP